MSKSSKVQKRRQAAHKSAAAERARKAAEKRKTESAPAGLSDEEKREFDEKYSKGGIIKNTLKIWRDSSPVTFITYFPVIFSHFAFTMLWFSASILIFIGPIAKIGVFARDFLAVLNTVMAAFGIPLILTYMHLKYDIKKKKYYFFNTLLYTLPASVIYAALNLLNGIIAVMFQEDRAKLITDQLEFSIYILLALIGTLTVFSCIAQLVLFHKRSKDEGPVTKLGLKLDKKENKKRGK